MTTEQQQIVMPKPKEAVEKMGEIARRNCDFWTAVFNTEEWERHDKTKEDVEALMNYFEGQSDMATECLRQVKRLEA
jgi:hypothetical protein